MQGGGCCPGATGICLPLFRSIFFKKANYTEKWVTLQQEKRPTGNGQSPSAAGHQSRCAKGQRPQCPQLQPVQKPAQAAGGEDRTLGSEVMDPDLATTSRPRPPACHACSASDGRSVHGQVMSLEEPGHVTTQADPLHPARQLAQSLRPAQMSWQSLGQSAGRHVGCPGNSRFLRRIFYRKCAPCTIWDRLMLRNSSLACILHFLAEPGTSGKACSQGAEWRQQGSLPRLCPCDAPPGHSPLRDRGICVPSAPSLSKQHLGT